ncbi:hypothetical protein DFAR_1510004 [Desulfarculales bacterium]
MATSQLEQVILNLISNATDAMPKEGRLISHTQNVEIDEIFCRTHPELHPVPYVLLRAADTGLGIDKETKRHIFELFFVTKQSGKGTGLGVSTIYGVVNSHMGLITCYSNLSQGLVFNLYFLVMTDSDVSNTAVNAGPEAELQSGSAPGGR